MHIFINCMILYVTNSLYETFNKACLFYKYYVCGHYPSSRLYLKTVLFIFKNNVSETGFCLRLQVKPTLLGPIDRASSLDRD
jgi:hypothetical protein